LFTPRKKQTTPLYVGNASTERMGVVYAFLSGKSQQLYELALNGIVAKCNELGLDIEADEVITDFEQSVFNAVRQVLEVRCRGCFYHLTQSTWRKIQVLGLTIRYREDEEVQHFCAMLDGLAFLPEHQVTTGMEFLRTRIPDGLEELVDYFDATYVSGTYRQRNLQNIENGIRLRHTPPRFPPLL
jgi:MULE transposase domain